MLLRFFFCVWDTIPFYNFFLNEKRKLFFEKITPILLSFIDELGIEVLLNKDTVALASTGSDITMVAIARINSQLK